MLDKQELTAYQLSAFKARTLAIESLEEMCSPRYNTIVLDNPHREGFLVYALAATTDPDAIPVGGHYRYMISSDGETIVSKEKLFASCLLMDKTPKDLPKGASLEALTMTHVVSNRPLETHIYLSLINRMDFYVGTADRSFWKIHEGKLSKLQ